MRQLQVVGRGPGCAEKERSLGAERLQSTTQLDQAGQTGTQDQETLPPKHRLEEPVVVLGLHFARHGSPPGTSPAEARRG